MVGRVKPSFAGRLRRERVSRDRWRKRRAEPLAPAEIVADAEAAAAEDGARFTPIRRYVLETLAVADSPLKAYDILKSIGDVGSESPPTVYRALDFLMDIGAVRRIESQSAFVALRHGATKAEIAFAVCEACGRVSELVADDAFDSLYAAAEALNGFSPRAASMEVLGVCDRCVRN